MATQWNKYEATAARKHGKPGREVRPKSTTIDIHSHVAIPRAAAYVKPHLDMSTIALAHFATPETKALSQKQEEDIRARITGYDERLADLDTMGIDLQLVMPPPNQCFYTVPLDISVQASRLVTMGWRNTSPASPTALSRSAPSRSSMAGKRRTSSNAA